MQINLLGDREDHSALHIVQLVVLGICVTLAVVGCVFFHIGMSSEIAVLTKEKAEKEETVAKLKKINEEVAVLEKQKKDLGNKLTAIAKLKAGKKGAVHVIDELNLSVPELAWLKIIKVGSGSIEINGIALDDQVISTFMQNLESMDYFKNIDLIVSSATEVEKVPVKEFNLIAEVVDPLQLKQEKDALKKAEEEQKRLEEKGKKNNDKA
jgi:type IV pilus assembly protein PilN